MEHEQNIAKFSGSLNAEEHQRLNRLYEKFWQAGEDPRVKFREEATPAYMEGLQGLHRYMNVLQQKYDPQGLGSDFFDPYDFIEKFQEERKKRQEGD
ncbi:MAG: hypothetical protein ACD_24C00009G0003 [uncultured bacterium]|nr:MAG: hypothetical protein ACD_24C00009G0003 [uncultured bacterium]